MSWKNDSEDRRSAYGATVFRVSAEARPEAWAWGPGPFAIVSARNPGVLLGDEENDRRHERLRQALQVCGLDGTAIVGVAPGGGHEELSLAVRCDRETARRLGREQGQEAVFLVEGGRLLLLSCEPGSPAQDLADWPARLETPPPRCLLHVPHSSTVVPEDVRGELLLGDDELAEELALVTDHDTAELFAPPGPGFAQVRHGVSRLVVDPERFEDDAQEPMAMRGWGVLYERRADGSPLRRRPSPTRREELLERHYRPHHAQLTAGVEAALAHHGRALVVDGHSFPDEPLPCDLDQSRPRPDICLGTDAFHTSPALVDALRQACGELGWSVDVDRPYRGTMVPLAFLEKDPRVASVMIEVNRRLYLDEACRRGAGFDEVRAGVQRLIRVAAEACGLGDEEAAG